MGSLRREVAIPEPRSWADRVKVGTRGRSKTGISAKDLPLKPLPTKLQNTLEALEKMFVVKNTFIHLNHWENDAAVGHRCRAASSPPSFRCFALATECGNWDVYSVADTEVSDGYAATFDSERTSEQATPWPASSSPATTGSTSHSEAMSNSGQFQTQTAVCKLSSSAKPWCPSSADSEMLPLAQLTQLSGAFATALEPAVRIVTVVASKMGRTYNSKVSVLQNTEGWSIIASIKNEDAWQAQKLLETAQAALISASETSQRVLVVNCKPLPAHDSGFRAVLGLVDDSSKACWDIFSAKGCTRGSWCQWQHPRFTRRLDVSVQFELSSDFIIPCN